MATKTLADGTIIKRMSPIGAQGKEHWKRAKDVAFMPDPVFDVGMALAHTELCAPGAVIVIAERGPKGGWPYVKFVESASIWFLNKQLRNKRTLHLGKIVST